MIDPRGTGRTQRMLEHAAQLAREGRYVFVISATAHHAKQLQARFLEMAGESAEKLEIVNGMPGKVYAWSGQVEFSYTVGSSAVDLLGPRVVLGAHPDCAFLVDHYAVEEPIEALRKRLARLEEMRDRWNR